VRIRLQTSLRSLLILVFVVSAYLGHIANIRNRESRIADAVRRAGGRVILDSDDVFDDWMQAGMLPEYGHPRRGIWARVRRAFEFGLVDRVVEIRVGGNREVDDQFAAMTAGLGELRRLDVSFTGLSESGVTEIVRSNRKLSMLNVSGILVSDELARELGRHPELRTLGVSMTGVSDVGVVAIAESRSLETVFVRNTPVSSNTRRLAQRRCAACRWDWGE
jgi:hypothetical protein